MKTKLLQNDTGTDSQYPLVQGIRNYAGRGS